MTCRFCGNPLVATGDVCNDRKDLRVGKCEACNLVQTMSLGWIARDEGGGQELWPAFNDTALNEHYEKVLMSQHAADSIFLVCLPQR